MKRIIDDEGIVCPVSGTANWTDIRQFNLMFKTFQVLQKILQMKSSKTRNSTRYFVELQNVQRSMRKNYHLVLAKLVSHSVMKLHQETSSSELENSNKWNWNSSVNSSRRN